MKTTKAFQVTMKVNPVNKKQGLNRLMEALDKFGLEKGYIITENQEDIKRLKIKLLKPSPSGNGGLEINL